MSRPWARLIVSLFLLLAGSCAARGQAPAAVAGCVTDQTGLPVADVTITASGQAGRGRPVTARSDANGLYVVRALAPGTYVLSFEFEGFRRQERTVAVGPDAVTLDVQLELAGIAQDVKVTRDIAEEPDREAPPGEVSVLGETVDRAPIGRTAEHAALMVPGVTANGPNGALTMAGGFSYGNLFLVDGLVANDSARGGARGFYIPDAVQETRVATGAVPAEYGRFQGGVIQTITRSGGNSTGGSLRVSVANDHWRALTPYHGDVTLNHRVPTWEFTVGGPILAKRLYYFGGSMGIRTEQSRTFAFAGGSYRYTDQERRYEAKLTWTPARSQTLRATYFRIGSSRTNASAGQVMDAASLYDTGSPESLAGVGYNTVLARRVVFESRFSRRRLTIGGAGSGDTSLSLGTPIWDRSRSDARFNSPSGCAVCDGASDERSTDAFGAKLLFTSRSAHRGSHEVATGIDLFREARRTNSYQSGSGFRVRATRTLVQDGQIYPVFLPDRTTWIYWQPVLRGSTGNDIRTYSAYVSDTWRASSRLTLKAGARLDFNDVHDSVGGQVVRDVEWSPRLGAAWNPDGRGRWVLSGGWSRYISGINTQVADAASPGGRPATYVYDYLGPAVNSSASPPLTRSPDALAVLFNWFLAAPGVGRTPRSSPSIPGVNLRVDPALGPLDTREAIAGVTRQLGRSGYVRVEGVYRRFLNFYSTRRDLTTGRVTDSAGVTNDVAVVSNSDSGVERTYRGLLTQASYRPTPRVQLSAAYTLASTFGNVDGEEANVGPSMVTLGDYPEYRDARWNAPMGPLAIDQRHRLRLWGAYDVRVPRAIGRLTLGFVQRVETGTPWSAVGNVNPKSYVPNPGYVTPPSSVPYYFSERGAYRYDTVVATDLSIGWTRTPPRMKKGQVYLRGTLTNAFNSSAAIRVNRTVLTRNDSVAYQAFNPFTATPVAGVHYGYGQDFGKPIGPSDYQAPREFSIAFGIRY